MRGASGPAPDALLDTHMPVKLGSYTAKRMRLVAVILLVCFILGGCGGASEPSGTHRVRPKSRPAAAANGPVVLGAKSFIVWGGIGFGTAHPSKLVVGSDPSVVITGIRWHGWGIGTHRESAATRRRRLATAATITESRFGPTCGCRASAGASATGRAPTWR